MMKKIFPRLLDAALISVLVCGGPDARTFAFWVIAIMVALLCLGIFAMDANLAQKICGRSILNRLFGVAMHFAYVAALIYSGFPVLAALYATVAFAIRVAAESKRAGQPAGEGV